MLLSQYPRILQSQSLKHDNQAQKPKLGETGPKSTDLAILLPPLINLFVICI